MPSMRKTDLPTSQRGQELIHRKKERQRKNECEIVFHFDEKIKPKIRSSKPEAATRHE